ncbi:MAG TPA: calcium-binding protein, partial [Thermomicrobiales bacterium]|nr:calcium-binding protein [Thermomicrobiales bacterium]
GVAIDTFSNVDGLSFVDPDGSGPLSGLTVNAAAGFAGINFDNIGGTLDLSSQAVSSVDTASPTAFGIDLQGAAGGETLVGNDDNNFFNGKTGADTLTGGGGNDVFLHTVGDGADAVDGGGQAVGGADVLLVAGQGGFTANAQNVDETLNVQLDNTGQIITQIDGSGSVTGIELTALDLGGGTDTLDYTGNSAGVTADLGAGTASGFTGVPGFFPAVQNVENVTGGDGDDTLTGDAGANVIAGGGGADTLTGGGGNDTLYGGLPTGDSGIDTAQFAGNASVYTITFDPFAAHDAAGPVATVSGPDGADQLHGIELLKFGDKTIDLTKGVLLYDASGHLIGTSDTIQGAVDAATAGDTIKITSGAYHENVTIATAGLTLIGEPGAVIQGTLKTDNNIADGDVASWLQTHPSYSGAAGDGITITADNVTVQNIAIDGFLHGVRFLEGTSVSGTTLDNVNVTGSIIGVEKSTTAHVSNFTLTGGSFSDGYIGLDIAKSTALGDAAVGLFDQVTIDGTSF